MATLSQFSMLLNAIFLASLLAFSNGLLKWVARREVGSYVELISGYWFHIGLSLAIYGFIFFYYIQLLRRYDITSLYTTYTGLSILMVLLIGVQFFGERLNLLQMIGCILVVSGIYLIGKT